MMKKELKFAEDAAEIKTAILKTLCNLHESWANYKKTDDKTRAIKDAFSTLGSEKGYKVYSHGCSPDVIEKYSLVDTEWLYDIIWYTDVKNEDYIMDRFILSVESEFGIYRDRVNNQKKPGGKYGAVKYDFQKLIASSSEMCLMIFGEKNNSALEDLGKYFVKALKMNNLTGKNQKIYILAGFDEDGLSFYKVI